MLILTFLIVYLPPELATELANFYVPPELAIELANYLRTARNSYRISHRPNALRKLAINATARIPNYFTHSVFSLSFEHSYFLRTSRLHYALLLDGINFLRTPETKSSLEKANNEFSRNVTKQPRIRNNCSTRNRRNAYSKLTHSLKE